MKLIIVLNHCLMQDKFTYNFCAEINQVFKKASIFLNIEILDKLYAFSK